MANQIETTLIGIFSIFLLMGLIFFAIGISDAGIIFSLVGAIFAGTGGVAISVIMYRRYIQRKVQQTGMAIYTDLLEVIYEHTKVNDIHAYRVRTQWLDTSTNTLYYFQSNYIAEDPTQKLQNVHKVRIMINPDNYAQYYMDLSFLH